MPRNTAIGLIEKFKTNNPFELAKYKNIHVIRWNLHNDISGFYKYLRRSKYIFLNSSLTDTESYFVCSHELGHALQHPRTNTPFLREKTLFSVDKVEVEANKFAVELLMTDDLLQEYNYLTIWEVAKIANVPREVVHLKDCKYL